MKKLWRKLPGIKQNDELIKALEKDLTITVYESEYEEEQQYRKAQLEIFKEIKRLSELQYLNLSLIEVHLFFIKMSIITFTTGLLGILIVNILI